jgi:hypothetical protein
MKFRKLYIENGTETANCPVKNTVRCCYININNIFVVSDKKIFQLNRKDLFIQKIFEENVPRYIDYINSNDDDNLLLMNHARDFIYNFNCGKEQSLKKKIKSCAGIAKSSGNDFMVFSPYEGIYNYNLEKNVITKLLAIEPYCNCILNKSGVLFVHCGKVIEKTYNTHKHIEPLSKIKIYKSVMENNYIEVDTKTDFTDFIFSEFENALYLIGKNSIYIYSLEDKKIIDEYTFDKKMIVSNIFIKEKMIFTYKFNEANILMSWKYK